MNIKSSLTIKFTAIVAAILLVFSLFTYEFSSLFRKNEFKDRLKNVSKNVVIAYLENEEFSANILKMMYEKQLNRFVQEKLIICDNQHRVIFTAKPLGDYETNLLKHLYQVNEDFETNKSDTEYIAYIVPHLGKSYFVVANAIDFPGHQKLQFLKLILIGLNIISIFIAALTGWYFSKQALQPIKDVVEQVETINESSLHQRVNEGNGKDEIAQLAVVFNEMLGRIEKSFSFQKLFVANASHEFRTPLTVMKGQIEVLMLSKRSEQEYVRTFESLLEDIQNLISLINGLTELASANADFPNISFKNVSMVDVIMESKQELLFRKPSFKIKLNWVEFPEQEECLQTQGDYSLLKSIFINLLDNACKFSAKQDCEIHVTFSKSNIEIVIRDSGAGISSSDLPHIFAPFYRSNETRVVPGYGIGLSLVKKTVEVHRGKISIHSVKDIGTEVTVILPNLTGIQT